MTINHLISVDGVDGVGKTTFINELKKHCAAYCYDKFGLNVGVAIVSPVRPLEGAVNYESAKTLYEAYDFLDSIKLTSKETLDAYMALANAAALVAAQSVERSFPGFDRVLTLFDRSFFSYWICQRRGDLADADLPHFYDCNIVLTDSAQAIAKRVAERRRTDDELFPDERDVDRLGFAQYTFDYLANRKKKACSESVFFVRFDGLGDAASASEKCAAKAKEFLDFFVGNLENYYN
jgi:thymidylate kinase